MKKNTVITSIFVVVVLTVSGFLLWRSPEDRKPAQVSDTDMSTKPATEQPEVDPNKVDADWKAYRNEEYGFEIKYPKSYAINENDQSPRFFEVHFLDPNNIEQLSIRVKVDPNNATAEPLDIHLDTQANSQVVLSGQKASVFVLGKGYCDGPGLCSPPISAVKALKNGNFYIVEFSGTSNISEGMPKKVLESFRFLR